MSLYNAHPVSVILRNCCINVHFSLYNRWAGSEANTCSHELLNFLCRCLSEKAAKVLSTNLIRLNGCDEYAFSSKVMHKFLIYVTICSQLVHSPIRLALKKQEISWCWMRVYTETYPIACILDTNITNLIDCGKCEPYLSKPCTDVHKCMYIVLCVWRYLAWSACLEILKVGATKRKKNICLHSVLQ